MEPSQTREITTDRLYRTPTGGRRRVLWVGPTSVGMEDLEWGSTFVVGRRWAHRHYVPEQVFPAPHDHKGFSEERCIRCGWTMGDGDRNNNDLSNLVIEGLDLSQINCPHCGKGLTEINND